MPTTTRARVTITIKEPKERAEVRKKAPRWPSRHRDVETVHVTRKEVVKKRLFQEFDQKDWTHISSIFCRCNNEFHWPHVLTPATKSHFSGNRYTRRSSLSPPWEKNLSSLNLWLVVCLIFLFSTSLEIGSTTLKHLEGTKSRIEFQTEIVGA